MELTAKNVHNTVLGCLYATREEGENDPQALEVKSVQLWAKFNPDRVAEQAENIHSMLDQLPEIFREEHITRGASFLLAPWRQDEVHWGEHRDVDALLALGLAVGRIHFTLPREMWEKLEFGVPHFTILTRTTAQEAF